MNEYMNSEQKYTVAHCINLGGFDCPSKKMDLPPDDLCWVF